MMNNDLDLDALLGEAAEQRAELSAALMARILSDAKAAHIPAPKPIPVKKTRGLPDWISSLVTGLGGGGAIAGLSLAGLTGLFLGMAEPAALQSVTALLSGETGQLDQMDLLPATGTLWTEN